MHVQPSAAAPGAVCPEPGLTGPGIRVERKGGTPRDPLVEVLLPVPLTFYSAGLETLVPGRGKLP